MNGIALKPAVTLTTGSEKDGLGLGRSTASANLLGQYQKDEWTWLINAGMTHNDNNLGNEKNLWNASTALLYSPNEQWTVGIDAGVSRNPSPESKENLSYAVIGIQRHIGKDMDVDVGLRQSLQSGPVENTLGVGFNLRW